MLSGRLHLVVANALLSLDDVGKKGVEPYAAFEGTFSTATLDGEVIDFLVEYEDGRHFAALAE